MELAHLTAPPDPHYGLPVVVCPRCTVASVRRPFGGTARWRSFLRTVAVSRRLVFGIWMFCLLTLLGTVICAGVANGIGNAFRGQPLGAIFDSSDLVRTRLHNWWIREGFWVVPVWAAVWSALGLFSGEWFSHWRARWYLAGMVILGAAAFAVPAILLGLAHWAHDGTPALDVMLHELRDLSGLASFVMPLAAGLLLSSLMLHIGLRAGRRFNPDRGLRSRRLRRARKNRSRES